MGGERGCEFYAEKGNVVLHLTLFQGMLMDTKYLEEKLCIRIK